MKRDAAACDDAIAPVGRTRASPVLTGALARRLILVLALFNALSFLNRQVPLVMVDPLKRGLRLDEVQIGLLNGFAFALFYALAILPFGWLVDRYQRRLVIAAGVALWSAGGIICGLSTSFEMISGGRILIGVGCAALAPAAYSMMGDGLAPDRIGAASSLFASGSTVGAGLAFAGGGLVLSATAASGLSMPFAGHLQNWQVVFLAAALPCLLLCWTIFTVPEPVRDRQAAAPGSDVPRNELAIFVRSNARFLALHFAGFGLLPVGLIAVTAWMPTYLVRQYDLTASQAGPLIALMVGVGCSLGTVFLGLLADRRFARGITDAYIRIYIPVLLLQLVSLFMAVATDNLYLCLAATAIFYSTLSFAGVAVAALALVSPPTIRGRITGSFVLFFTLSGTGCGPLLTAAVTTYIFADPKMLGWSMLLVNAIILPVVAAFMTASLRPFRQTVSRLGQRIATEADY